MTPVANGCQSAISSMVFDARLATCGNGQVDAGEACDGTALNGATCLSLGYGDGTLACTSTCTFDYSGCTVPAGWTCSPNLFHDGNCDCGCGIPDLDCPNATVAACSSCDAAGSCSTAGCPGNIDPTNNAACAGASTCGNSVIDPGEQCDGANLNGKSCESQGFSGGKLACSKNCVFDVSGCTGWTCSPAFYGDGVCDCGCGIPDPDCANSLVASCAFCSDAGSCATTCANINPNNNAVCNASACGNGRIDPGEACDGSNLNGQTCRGLQFTGGTLACLPGCTFDLSGCTGWTCSPAFYGDGFCDCGCGVPDPDCANSLVTSCFYCNDAGSCATTCSQISPSHNAVCGP